MVSEQKLSRGLIQLPTKLIVDITRFPKIRKYPVEPRPSEIIEAIKKIVHAAQLPQSASRSV